MHCFPSDWGMLRKSRRVLIFLQTSSADVLNHARPEPRRLKIQDNYCLKKNQNAPRPSEHPPVRGKNIKTLRWDHRLQIQNLFMAFKRVPLW